jgi:hypothetical protein
MITLRKLLFRFFELLYKRRFETSMDDEMRSHIEMQTQENIEAGMAPGEARRTALRDFGWEESIKETCWEQRGTMWVDNLGYSRKMVAGWE